MQVSIRELNQNVNTWINRAEQSRDCVLVTANDGQAKAVLIGIEAFEALLGIQPRQPDTALSLAEWQEQFRQALAAAGYHTREEMIALVRDVRRELAAERAENKLTQAPQRSCTQ